MDNHKEPLVTVLLNCYNEQKYISQSIKSIINQTYKSWEMIIWDDKSSDDTLKIAKSFKDKRIQIFQNKEHLGLGPSRIMAQEKINGDFVAILDADDFSEKSRLEKQVEIFKKYQKVNLVCSWVKLINIDNKEIGQKIFSDQHLIIRDKLAYENIIPHPSVMYKVEDAKKTGWYDKNLEYAQDYDLSIKLLNLGECFVIKDFLTNVRIRNDSMTLSKKLRKLRIKEAVIILGKANKIFNLNAKIKYLNKRNIQIYEFKLAILNLSLNNFFSDIKNLFKKFFQLFITFFQIS